MSRVLTEKAKAIQTNLSLFYEKTCSHLMFVTVSVLLPFLCMFTCSLFVMCLWYMLVYIVLKKVCVFVYVCGCIVYKCTRWDMRTMTWVTFGTAHQGKGHQGYCHIFDLLRDGETGLEGKVSNEHVPIKLLPMCFKNSAFFWAKL